MVEIGQRVRELREERRITQAALAKKLGMADETVVSKIEHGTRGLAAAELAKMCDYFGIGSDALVFGETGVGALLRSNGSDAAERVVAQVESAFADLRYVRALVES